MRPNTYIRAHRQKDEGGSIRETHDDNDAAEINLGPLKERSDKRSVETAAYAAE